MNRRAGEKQFLERRGRPMAGSFSTSAILPSPETYASESHSHYRDTSNALSLDRLGLACLGTGLMSPARADELNQFTITIYSDRLEPSEAAVPADVEFGLRIENQSTNSAEWESHAPHREKIVPERSATGMAIGPMKAGGNEFFDDFHPEIRGHVVAR